MRALEAAEDIEGYRQSPRTFYKGEAQVEITEHQDCANIRCKRSWIWLFKVSSFGIDVTFLLTPGSSLDMRKQCPYPRSLHQVFGP